MFENFENFERKKKQKSCPEAFRAAFLLFFFKNFIFQKFKIFTHGNTSIL